MNKLRRVTLTAAVALTGVSMAFSCAVAPGAHAAVTKSAKKPVQGIDISAYQHTGKPISWLKVARSGVSFVSIKASEGNYYRNPFFASDARAAPAAGLVVYPYVFANPARASGKSTAAYAIGALGGRRTSGQPPLVVDLENDPYKQGHNCYGVKPPAMVRWIAGFVGRIHTLTGRDPIIYTTSAWWQQCTRSTRLFRTEPLWLAVYGGTPVPPSPWSAWAFLQYADNGEVPGIGRVDLDSYHPTDAMPSLRGTRPKPKSKKKLAARKSKPKKAVPGKAKHKAKPKPKKAGKKG